ncbi:MAG: Gfo/Idh/MocA family oxidoreductase [Halioglobus sp.]
MAVNNPLQVVIVGARSVRQGTGPFIAAGLHAEGAKVVGIVGTSEASLDQALAGLSSDWGIKTTGYVDLKAALKELQPDAVAICSPWRFHAEQLQQVAEAGCHCLVEKPLAWPATEVEIDALIAQFESRSLLLHLVGQWPTTLSAFAELHPDAPTGIDSFSMRLSPVSIGEDMITDAAPHFISMLQAIAGPGECLSCDITLEPGANKLALNCQYQHKTGSLSAQLLLETCSERPRPAWYEINGLRANRSVTLPEYTQELVCQGKRVPIADPMHQVTTSFLSELTAGAATKGDLLRSAHRNLLQLASAWR